MELDQPCRGLARTTTPLFADRQGLLLSHSRLDSILHALLLKCFDSSVADTHSWHSFRIGLACALHAAGADDATIQLACRWLSPESLRLYRRLGTSEVIAWVDSAERANVDTIQQGNVVTVDNSAAFGALFQTVQSGAPSTKPKQLQCALDQATMLIAPQSGSPPAGSSHSESSDDDEPDDTPLTPSNCAGRRVMVPASLWPSYPCREHGGTGWAARVVRSTRHGALIRFLYARTSTGRPYDAVELQLGSLTPL